MRAIKFRFWWPWQKRLFRPEDLSAAESLIDGMGNSVSATSDGEITKDNDGDANDVELSQFTGLLDANHVEIYDGDIVRSEYSALMYIVEWSGDLPGWFPFLDQLSGEDYEALTGHRVKVVGNKWENPALAEECEG